MSTIEELADYERKLKAWHREQMRPIEDWKKRGGESGLGGKWDARNQRYTVAPKPEFYFSTEPKFLGSNAFAQNAAMQIRKKILGL